jgi:hypothetical protein
VNTLPTFPAGTLDLILECQEMLAGERKHFTPLAEYTDQRLRYWQMQAMRPPRLRRLALPREHAA